MERVSARNGLTMRTFKIRYYTPLRPVNGPFKLNSTSFFAATLFSLNDTLLFGGSNRYFRERPTCARLQI